MHQRAGFVFCPVFFCSIPMSADISTYLAVHWFAFFMLHHSASSVEGTALEWLTYSRTVWGPHTTWRSERRKMSWIYWLYCSICHLLREEQFPCVIGGDCSGGGYNCRHDGAGDVASSQHFSQCGRTCWRGPRDVSDMWLETWFIPCTMIFLNFVNTNKYTVLQSIYILLLFSSYLSLQRLIPLLIITTHRIYYLYNNNILCVIYIIILTETALLTSKQLYVYC